MDCKLFSEQLFHVARHGAMAMFAVRGGDSKKAARELDEAEKWLGKARENLGKVGA